MGEKQLVKRVKEEIEQEHEMKKQKADCSDDDEVEFVNSKCYCSDHSEHGAFV